MLTRFRPIGLEARHQSEPIDVVHIVVREGLSDVFAAQVLNPASKHGPEVASHVVACDAVGSLVRQRGQRSRRDRAERAASLGVKLSAIPSPPARLPWLWDEAPLLKRWLRNRFAARTPFVLHGRGINGTLLALRMRPWFPDARIVFDCRGAEPAEQLEHMAQGTATPAHHRRVRATEHNERLAARQADHVLCVSHMLADYLIQRHAVQRSAITVIPCCTDVDAHGDAAIHRDAVRGELKCRSRFVVAYCGTLGWYQLPEESLRVFRLIRSIRPDAYFMALTRDTERMEGLCRAEGLTPEQYTILSLAPSAVPRYLAAADLGLLPRADSLINRVASPIKFAEYLASGTPVALSSGIGDYSQLTRCERLGILLAPFGTESEEAVSARLREFLEEYTSSPDVYRRRCQEVARQQLNWRVHMPKLGALYRQLTNRDERHASTAVGH